MPNRKFREATNQKDNEIHETATDALINYEVGGEILATGEFHIGFFGALKCFSSLRFAHADGQVLYE